MPLPDRMRGIVPAVLLGLLLLAGCNLSDSPDATATPTETETLQPTPTGDDVIPPATFGPTDTFSPTVTAESIQNATAIVPTNLPPGVRPTGTLPIGVRAPTATLAPTLTPGGSTATPTTTATIVFPTTYQNRYEAQVGTGRTLLVNYTVLLNRTDAVVFILVNNPAGEEVYRLAITESAEDTAEIAAETGGTYEILVGFRNLGGTYSVTFGVE